MEGYSSEQEQIEAIKSWWRQNGKAVILGIGAGATVIVGGRWWMGQQETRAELASAMYEQVLTDIRLNESESAADRGARMLDEYGATSYAMFTALTLAKLAVEQGDLTMARTRLQWVIDHSEDAALKDVARLRLARVLLGEGDHAAALAQAEAVAGADFALPKLELKGDAYLALGRMSEAHSAYSAALAASEGGLSRARLEMKLDAASQEGSS